MKFMKNKLKLFYYKNRFYIAGVFFLILQILIISKYLFLLDFENMLWFCSHVPLILAIGFFTKNFDLIKGIISVGLIIQFIWILDFLGQLFFYGPLIGFTNYMFVQNSFISYITSIFEHLSGLIALFLTYKILPSKKTLLYSFIYLFLIWIITIIFSNSTENYNLIQNIIIFNNFTFPGYIYLYVLIGFFLIVIPTYFFQLLLYRVFKEK